MSISLAAWQVTDEGPQRLTGGAVALEKDLEGWIAKDPTLLQAGLKIVGRQLWTASGPLDLLAIAPQGNWVVIEVKKGHVRRETVGQAIDYAACIQDLAAAELRERCRTYLSECGSAETIEAIADRCAGDPLGDERSVSMMVVGTGRDPGLERMINFLGRGEIEISVVTFEVYRMAGGEQIVVREWTETDAPLPLDGGSEKLIEAFLHLADQRGDGSAFRAFVGMARELELGIRPGKHSIMLTPPRHRGKCLITIWHHKTSPGKVRVWLSTNAFEDFLGLSNNDVARELQVTFGENLDLDLDRVPAFVQQVSAVIHPAVKEDG